MFPFAHLQPTFLPQQRWYRTPVHNPEVISPPQSSATATAKPLRPSARQPPSYTPPSSRGPRGPGASGSPECPSPAARGPWRTWRYRRRQFLPRVRLTGMRSCSGRRCRSRGWRRTSSPQRWHSEGPTGCCARAASKSGGATYRETCGTYDKAVLSANVRPSASTAVNGSPGQRGPCGDLEASASLRWLGGCASIPRPIEQRSDLR